MWGGRPLVAPSHPTHSSCELWWGLVVLKNHQKHWGNEAFASDDTQLLVHFEGSILNYWSILGVRYSLFGPHSMPTTMLSEPLIWPQTTFESRNSFP